MRVANRAHNWHNLNNSAQLNRDKITNTYSTLMSYLHIMHIVFDWITQDKEQQVRRKVRIEEDYNNK